MVSTATTAKRRQKRKKKRISKHILESRERNKNNNNEETTTTTESNTQSTTTKQQHEKDPNEASNYITMWKQREHGGWKFNKNTQSWLIRHMYEAEKVTKTTFSTLMEYFVDLKGNTRDRVKEDATRRALRYKQWETNSSTQEKNTDKQSEGKKEENNNDTTTSEDAKKWSELSDHDKRKEYKRARKVLETLK